MVEYQVVQHLSTMYVVGHAGSMAPNQVVIYQVAACSYSKQKMIDLAAFAAAYRPSITGKVSADGNAAE